MTQSLLRTPRRRRVALAVLPLVLALGACADDGADPTPAGDTASDTPTASEEPTTGSPSEDPSTSETPEAGGAIPVYYAGDAPDGTRLFREFHAADGSDRLTQVALAVDGGEPLDGDYRTLWPGSTVAGVEASGDALEVTLQGDAFTEAPDGMTRREARLAIQQMVYSLQGAAQERLPVRFVRESGDTTLFGIDVSEPVTQANALRVLNLISITSPAEGSEVASGALEVTGVANSFEASGPCELARAGEVVETVPYVADGWMDERLFPFTATFEQVAPGDYVLTCSTDDPTGGTEGIGAMSDTKELTVR